MPMTRYQGGFLPKEVVYAKRGLTSYLRVRTSRWNPSLKPIVYLHGWPQANDVLTTLYSNLPVPNGASLPFDAFLATGRTIYMPFTGSNFGHPTNSYPFMGGTGTNAIFDILSQATEDGCIFDKVDFLGGSMGAINTLNWAIRNEALVGQIFLFVPGIEFSSLYDLGGALRETLVELYGGANKTDFMLATVDNDPMRMDINSLASRILTLASNPDGLIRYQAVVDWTQQWGIPLITTSSNHFSLDDNAFHEMDVLAWLDKSEA